MMPLHIDNKAQSHFSRHFWDTVDGEKNEFRALLTRRFLYLEKHLEQPYPISLMRGF
ncbi:hypothetical protein [Spongiibacter tropicus]|uniref:hypothetical protein n=1 Tax=Spongiibacter tropicus TaxID=454602 RepID=UPI0023545E34|nr:hypothetical protein [Spongiibacter tropicus]|tara:strand:- start:983 stop:1153 length:171 start_codon:yes stop_codon:yes gene_type:complete